MSELENFSRNWLHGEGIMKVLISYSKSKQTSGTQIVFDSLACVYANQRILAIHYFACKLFHSHRLWAKTLQKIGSDVMHCTAAVAAEEPIAMRNLFTRKPAECTHHWFVDAGNNICSIIEIVKLFNSLTIWLVFAWRKNSTDITRFLAQPHGSSSS